MNLADSAVSRLAGLWGLDEKAQREQLLAVIDVIYPYNAFVDESYGSPVAGVAAYVSGFDRWLKLEEEWRGILAKFEVPLDGKPEHLEPFFHTTDFIARKKQFENAWQDAKRDELMARLTTTASEHTVLGVGCCVNQQEYQRGLPDDIRGNWREPYFFCIWGVLGILLGLEDRYPVTLPKPLWFLFDQRKKSVKFAAEIFYTVKRLRDKTGTFGSMGFGEMWNTPQLQAADLLVYETTRSNLERAHNPSVDMRKSLKTLGRKKNLLLIDINEERLQRYVKFVRQAERAESASDDD